MKNNIEYNYAKLLHDIKTPLAQIETLIQLINNENDPQNILEILKIFSLQTKDSIEKANKSLEVISSTLETYENLVRKIQK